MSAIYLSHVLAILVNVHPMFSKRTEAHVAMAKNQQVGFQSSFYGLFLSLSLNYLHEIAIIFQQVIVLTACVPHLMLNVRKFGAIIVEQQSVNAMSNLTRKAQWMDIAEWITLDDTLNVNQSKIFLAIIIF